MEAHRGTGWLMAIDLQPAFYHPESPWFTPGLAEIADRIAALAPVFGEQVLLTRFVPPPVPFGSWGRYYEKWPFAHDPSSDWLWSLDRRWASCRSVASHRFSKWLPEVSALFGSNPTVVLCGVSTDCCVLATALAAVDDGAHVRLVTDACAAKGADVHERALDIMAARSPQLTLVTVAEELERLKGQRWEQPA